MSNINPTDLPPPGYVSPFGGVDSNEEPVVDQQRSTSGSFSAAHPCAGPETERTDRAGRDTLEGAPPKPKLSFVDKVFSKISEGVGSLGRQAEKVKNFIIRVLNFDTSRSDSPDRLNDKIAAQGRLCEQHAESLRSVLGEPDQFLKSTQLPLGNLDRVKVALKETRDAFEEKIKLETQLMEKYEASSTEYQGVKSQLEASRMGLAENEKVLKHLDSLEDAEAGEVAKDIVELSDKQGSTIVYNEEAKGYVLQGVDTDKVEQQAKLRAEGRRDPNVKMTSYRNEIEGSLYEIYKQVTPSNKAMVAHILNGIDEKIGELRGADGKLKPDATEKAADLLRILEKSALSAQVLADGISQGRPIDQSSLSQMFKDLKPKMAVFGDGVIDQFKAK